MDNKSYALENQAMEQQRQRPSLKLENLETNGDSERETFRKALDKSGVTECLVKTVEALMLQSKLPQNPMLFVSQFLAARYDDPRSTSVPSNPPSQLRSPGSYPSLAFNTQSTPPYPLPAAPFSPSSTNNGAFDSTNGPFNSTNGPFNSTNGLFNTSNGPFNSSNGPFHSSNGSFNSSNSPFNPTNGPFSPTNGHFNSTSAPFNSTTGAFNPSNGPYSSTGGPFNNWPLSPAPITLSQVRQRMQSAPSVTSKPSPPYLFPAPPAARVDVSRNLLSKPPGASRKSPRLNLPPLAEENADPDASTEPATHALEVPEGLETLDRATVTSSTGSVPDTEEEPHALKDEQTLKADNDGPAKGDKSKTAAAKKGSAPDTCVLVVPPNSPDTSSPAWPGNVASRQSATDQPATDLVHSTKPTGTPVDSSTDPGNSSGNSVTTSAADAVISTTSPGDWTANSVNSTANPVKSTDHLVNSTTHSVKPTSNSVNATDHPVNSTTHSVKPTSNSVNATDHLVNSTTTPVKPTSNSVNATDHLVNSTTTPVKPTSNSVNATDHFVKPTTNSVNLAATLAEKQLLLRKIYEQKHLAAQEAPSKGLRGEGAPSQGAVPGPASQGLAPPCVGSGAPWPVCGAGYPADMDRDCGLISAPFSGGFPFQSAPPQTLSPIYHDTAFSPPPGSMPYNSGVYQPGPYHSPPGPYHSPPGPFQAGPPPNYQSLQNGPFPPLEPYQSSPNGLYQQNSCFTNGPPYQAIPAGPYQSAQSGPYGSILAGPSCPYQPHAGGPFASGLPGYSGPVGAYPNDSQGWAHPATEASNGQSNTQQRERKSKLKRKA